MPEFANPSFLWSLLAIPVLVWCLLRRKRPALAYPNVGFLNGLPAGRSRIARWGGIAMRAGGLLLLIVAVAGPRWPDRRTRLATEGIAIAMVADVSGSMAEQDFPWRDQRISRLDAMKRAFVLFIQGGEGPEGEKLEGRPGDQVSLVTFATRPETTCPLTLSHGVLLRMLDAEQARGLPTESQTNIGDAIAWALRRLESAGSGRKIMVLLSDGEHNVPPPALTPRQAAQLAANLHVVIHAIDAGGDPNEATPEEQTRALSGREAGERTLQAVARITGGRYFRAHDSRSLLAVCQEIDRLERQPIQSFRYRRYHEGYPWFGLAALLLLTGVLGLEMTLWQRVP
jgi:Ca-activated chloride channel homolog